MENIKIIRSRRKTIALEIRENLEVVVRVPLDMKDADINSFLKARQPWIEKNLRRMKSRNSIQLPKLSEEELAALMEAAKTDICQRVERLSKIMGVSVAKITIRRQKTRWGSCSNKGNLNFNCLLMLCPEDVREYVVVHELCHRIEMNHSRRFWQVLGRFMPDYQEKRRWLRENGNMLISRLG